MKNLKLFVFTVAAAVSLVTIRSIQLIFLTDSSTGFYYEGTKELAIGLTVFMSAITVLAAVMGFFVKKEHIDLKPDSSVLFGGAAMLAGIAHIAEPFFYKAIFSESIPEWMIIARLAMLVSAGLTFIYIGYGMLFNKKVKYEATIVLVVALIARLMSTFVSYSGMSNISENTIDVIMLVTTLVFFYLHSKSLCGIKNKRTTIFVFVFGIAAVLSSVLSALPGIIVAIFSSVPIIHVPVDSPVTVLFTAVYIIVYLINISKNAVGQQE